MNNNKQFSFGIDKAIFYSVIAVFTMQFIGGIIQFPAFFYQPLNHILLPLGFFAGIVSAIAVLLAILKTNIKPIIKDLKTKFSFIKLLLSVLIWFCFLPVCELLTTLIPTTGFFEGLYKFFEATFAMFLNYKIAGFIMICILAPIFEEILFRGIILKGMLNKNINPTYAIIISGFIFGAAHLNPWQFIGAGLLGSIFGFIYYRTKSLVLPIILHALNNILSYTFIIQNEATTDNIFEVSNYLFIACITIIAIILCYILYRITQQKIS